MKTALNPSNITLINKNGKMITEREEINNKIAENARELQAINIASIEKIAALSVFIYKIGDKQTEQKLTEVFECIKNSHEIISMIINDYKEKDAN